MKDITKNLSKNIVCLDFDLLPSEVIHESKRAFLNWLGVAVGGSNYFTLEILKTLSDIAGGNEQATVLGTGEKKNIFFTALLNAASSHALDFDDTHWGIILHPSAPVAPAVLAVAELYELSGKDVLEAYITGVETSCRIGKAVYPSLFNMGWHATATLGTIGAAVGTGKILKLDEGQMVNAIAVACTQASGLLAMSGGHMTKHLHPGKAAMNGLIAAWLAKGGFVSSDKPLEHQKGFFNAFAPGTNAELVNDSWGEKFELLENTYKPFACGVVTHPIITGIIDLRNDFELKAEDILEIEVRVHSLVLERTGINEPKNDIEAKFSAYHCAAVGLIYGKAGEEQFSDEIVHNETVINLRKKVKLNIDENISRESVDIKVITRNGRIIKKFVENSKGSYKNPMTDKELEEKFNDLALNILSREKIEKSIGLAWDLENVKNIKSLVELCCP